MRNHTVDAIILVFIIILSYGLYFYDLTLPIIIGNPAGALGYITGHLIAVLLIPSIVSLIMFLINRKWPHKVFMIIALSAAALIYFYFFRTRLYLESLPELMY